MGVSQTGFINATGHIEYFIMDMMAIVIKGMARIFIIRIRMGNIQA